MIGYLTLPTPKPAPIGWHKILERTSAVARLPHNRCDLQGGFFKKRDGVVARGERFFSPFLRVEEAFWEGLIAADGAAVA